MTQLMQIEVAYVNPPKEGAKKGSIKTKDGKYISVWPDKLNQFTVGGRYSVNVDATTTDEGKTFFSLKNVVGSTPAQAGNAGAAKGGARSSDDAMAVMAIVGKAYEGTGGIPDAATLAMQMKAIRVAWHRAFNEFDPTTVVVTQTQRQQQQNGEEFNDEVPF